MSRTFVIRFVIILVMIAAALGCGRRTVREYTQGRSGQVVVKDVSEEDYWKRQVEEHIDAEVKHEKPEGYDSWRSYYSWWFGVIRHRSKPPWKSTQFKTTEDMVTYIKERRRARGLPEYE